MENKNINEEIKTEYTNMLSIFDGITDNLIATRKLYEQEK